MSSAKRLLCAGISLALLLLPQLSMPWLPFAYVFVWACLLWISPQKAALFFLLVLLLGNDIVPEGSVASASVFTTVIFGKSLFLFWTIFVGLLLFAGLGMRRQVLQDRASQILLFFLILSALVGLQNGSTYSPSYISDLGFLINILIGYWAAFAVVKTRCDVRNFLSLFAVALSTKVLFTYLYSDVSGPATSFLTSEAYLLPFLLLYSVIDGLLYSGLASSFHLLSHPSRGRIVIFLASAAVFFVFSKRKMGFLLLPLVVLLSFQLVDALTPGSLVVLDWKIKTLHVSSSDLGQSDSAMIRLIEFKNILSGCFGDALTFVAGVGAGGYFVDKAYPFPFSLYGMYTYQDDWISSGRYYKPHGTPLYVLLKYGIPAFFLLYGALLRKVFRASSLLRAVDRKDTYFAQLSLLVGISLMGLFWVNYTSKLQVFTGVFLGLASLLERGGLADSAANKGACDV